MLSESDSGTIAWIMQRERRPQLSTHLFLQVECGRTKNMTECHSAQVLELVDKQDLGSCALRA